MGIIRKIKTWWNSTTTAERILSVLGITSTATAICVSACSIHHMNKIDHDVENMHVEVNLVPQVKDYGYDRLVAMWRDLEKVHDEDWENSRKENRPTNEHLDDGLSRLLDMIQEAAIKEGREKEYEKSDIPMQLYD